MQLSDDTSRYRAKPRRRIRLDDSSLSTCTQPSLAVANCAVMSSALAVCTGSQAVSCCTIPEVADHAPAKFLLFDCNIKSSGLLQLF
jgi:hypothetical protein